jgi:hypothetical protein
MLTSELNKQYTLWGILPKYFLNHRFSIPFFERHIDAYKTGLKKKRAAVAALFFFNPEVIPVVSKFNK